MSKPLQSYSLSAPGFYGLNTEESPLDLGIGFALVGLARFRRGWFAPCAAQLDGRQQP